MIYPQLFGDFFYDNRDYFSHKVTHAFVGALGGAVQGEEGMISGAVGAVTGEVLAEAFKPVEQLRSEIYAEHPHYDTLSKTDQWSIVQSKTDTHRKAWKFLSAFAGGLVGGNANVAYQAADTAIENNYIQVAILGLTVAYIGYVGYQVGTEVVNGKYEEALKILGIEVVTFAVGGVVAKGAVAGGKVAFRFVGGTKTYATVAEALSAAYDKTPGLKLCMQSAHNKIVKAFEKFESSSVGKKLGEWDAKLAGRGNAAATVAEAEVAETKNLQSVGDNSSTLYKPGGAIRKDAIPEGSRLEYLGPGRVKFDGVEFRAVRDLSHLSDDTIKKMSKTGVAPRDIYGEILEGHHHRQQYHREPAAFVVQIPESLHSTGNLNQHPLGKSGGIGTNTAERKDWNKLRTAFHKALADNEKLRRGIQ